MDPSLNIEDYQILQEKFYQEKKVATGVKQKHQFYCYKLGNINKTWQLSKYNIENPESESLLQNSSFNLNDAATCFQQKSLQLFFHKNFTLAELHDAILNYTQDGAQHIGQYVSCAKRNASQFKQKYHVTQDYAYGCCLAMSYYTGSQSQRVSRSCAIIIKLYGQCHITNISSTEQYQGMRCIGHWLLRALNCIQLHWGKVTRCINLSQEEYQFYKPGNIITWLQFSSSSHGGISPYFAIRNTRFVIYSLSGRCIEKYSNYSGTETEVLFKPFSHFLVFKRQHKDGKQYIYMRQVFIGQSTKNVLWVDDNIFDQKWQNKKIMEMALIKQPLLNIVPKCNTKCALAFLQSQIGQNRNPKQFRIITDMTRLNEQPSQNAGARFVQACKNLNVRNEILVFTSNKTKAQQQLKKLLVSKDYAKITIVVKQALNFLLFQ